MSLPEPPVRVDPMSTPTPHIGAQAGDFAPDVLMPGDPRRATRIAETVLTDARLVTEVRGVLGYTGTFDGRPVSVLASGMGMPSMTIYATELYRFYDVRRIVRIDTAGAMAPHLELGDVVIASAAHTDSAIAAGRVPGVTYAHTPSFHLLAAAAEAGGVARRPAPPAAETPSTAGRRRRRARKGAVHVGAVLSTDLFYADRPETIQRLVDHGTLAVEMEAAALYGVADAERREALAICTVSDLLFKDAALSADEREHLFDRSVALGLAALAAS